VTLSVPVAKRCKDCPDDVRRRPAPHPGPRCSTHHRAVKRSRSERASEQRVEKLFGLTPGEYDVLLAAQEGRCYLCGRGPGRRRRLAVDHDHVTGVVYGLACLFCNTEVLGRLGRDPDTYQRAADNLRTPPAVQLFGVRTVPGHGEG
jgi:recombination endonuclease VII